MGTWHIISLNSEVDVDANGAQVAWLKRDLAAHRNACVLAYWHKPRFSSGYHGNIRKVQPFWQALYDANADVVLNGHDHDYERFAPQTPTGVPDRARGIREFVVGTGGAGLRAFSVIERNSEVRISQQHGVIRLSLPAGRYSWAFVGVDGRVKDSGAGSCH